MADQHRARLFVVGSLGRRFDFGRLARRPPGRIIDFLDLAVDEGWLDPADNELLELPPKMPSGKVFAGHLIGPKRRNPDGDPALAWTHEGWRQIHAAEGMGSTLTTKTNSRYLVLFRGRVRRITLDECRRLMGLPNGVRVAGQGVEETTRLVGNGVYVPLVAEQARQGAEQLRGHQEAALRPVKQAAM